MSFSRQKNRTTQLLLLVYMLFFVNDNDDSIYFSITNNNILEKYTWRRDFYGWSWSVMFFFCPNVFSTLRKEKEPIFLLVDILSRMIYLFLSKSGVICITRRNKDNSNWLSRSKYYDSWSWITKRKRISYNGVWRKNGKNSCSFCFH